MDFALDKPHRTLLDEFDVFVERELVPLQRDADWQADDRVPPDIMAKVRLRSAELGFYGVGFPADVGGSGIDPLGAVLLAMHAHENRCRLAQLAVPGPEGPTQLLLQGTEEQRQRHLRPLVQGRAIRSLAVTEPTAGSDVSAMRTRAHHQPDGSWRLNGTKTFVTNGKDADVCIVLAVSGEPVAGRAAPVTAFLVEHGTIGLTVTREIHGMWGGDRRFEIRFDNCRLGPEAVLGGRDGVDVALFQLLDSFSDGRLIIAAKCVGLARQALRLATEYARIREAFGVRIGQHQHVQAHLVNALVRMDAAELLVLRGAWRRAQGIDSASDSAAAKLVAAEDAFTAVDAALQVLGGLGYTRDVPIERLFRQLRLYRIVDGTTEIQKVIIAHALLGF